MQEVVLKRTHGSLKKWVSDVARRVLEQDGLEAQRILQVEVDFVSRQFTHITSQLDALDVHSDLYDMAVRMGAHTRDAQTSLNDVEVKLASGDLLRSYVQRELFSDCNATN